MKEEERRREEQGWHLPPFPINPCDFLADGWVRKQIRDSQAVYWRLMYCPAMVWIDLERNVFGRFQKIEHKKEGVYPNRHIVHVC